MGARVFVVSAAFVLCVGSESRGSFIAFTFSGGSSTTGLHATYGFQFTPVVAITVDSLGFFDAGQDGLADGHPVGIWTTSGTLLASATVTTANSVLDGPVINGGQYRFTPIPGLDLVAGTTYVFGAGVGVSTDTWFAGGTNVSNAPSLVTVSSTGLYTLSDFSLPDQTIGNKYAAGSFTATETHAPVSAPAPPGVLLALSGLFSLGGFGWLRRRRLAAAA